MGFIETSATDNAVLNVNVDNDNHNRLITRPTTDVTFVNCLSKASAINYAEIKAAGSDCCEGTQLNYN